MGYECGAAEMFRFDGELPTLVVRGEIDFPNLGAFRGALCQLLHDADRLARADLSGVTYCNATAINLVAGMCRRAANSGKRLVVVPSPIVQQLIAASALQQAIAREPVGPPPPR